ncbi:hypothetical protein AABB24_018432, partial [Solanum stoloniferum]
WKSWSDFLVKSFCISWYGNEKSDTFCCVHAGFQALEELYYQTWLHSGQRVIVQDRSNDQDQFVENVVTIQGLTSSGYLLGITDDGQMCELHPDGNSFDFFKGLIKRKMS